MAAWGAKTTEENSTYPLSETGAGEMQGLRTGRLLLLLQRLFFIDKSRTPSADTEGKKHLDSVLKVWTSRTKDLRLPIKCCMGGYLDRWVKLMAS